MIDRIQSLDSQARANPDPIPVGLGANDASLAGPALRGMLWVSYGKAGRALLQIGILAILARLVTPAEFGLVSAAFVVIGFAAIFAHIGLGKGLIQHPALRREHIAMAFYISVFLALVFCGVTCVLAVPIANFFRIPSLAPILRVLSISFPLKAIAMIPESLLQRELRFQWLANRELASYAIGYGCVGVAFAFAGYGAWALVLAHLAQASVSTILLLVAQPIPLSILLKRTAFDDLLYFSGGYTLGRIANHFASEGDKFVVGRWLGPAALGIYGRAFQLMAVPADIFGDILDTVLFPTMAKLQEDTPLLARAYRRGVSLIAIVMLPLSIFFYLAAPAIVLIILGSAWVTAVKPFQWLALGLLFRTSCRMSDALARANGFVYQRAWRQGLYAVLVIGGAWVGHFWGIAGSAVGVLIALCVNFFLMAQLSLRITEISWKTFFGAHIPAILLASSSGLVVHISSVLAHLSGVPNLILLTCSSAAVILNVIFLAYAWPQFFLGQDGLWMINSLRVQFPPLRRLRLPSAVGSCVRE